MTAAILPPARTVFFDTNAVPLVGGYVYMYVPNTTTFKTTWQDAGQTTSNSNPIVLDGQGSCLLYGSGQYLQEVYDSNNNLIWTGLTTSNAGAATGITSINSDTTSSQIITGSTAISVVTATGTTTITYTGGMNNSGTTGTLAFYATSGTTLSPLTLGSNLTIAGTTLNANSTASTAFSAITAGTNTAQALLIGNGSSLGTTGTGTITATAISGTLAIASGGTGQTTAANAINALLPSQTGQSGNFLTTNGTSASWGAGGGGGGGALTLLVTANASGASSVAFNSTYITTAYNKYIIEFDGLYGSSGSTDLLITGSTNNGSGYVGSGYKYSGLYCEAAGGGTPTGVYLTSQSNINVTLGTGNISATSTSPAAGTIKLSNLTAAVSSSLCWQFSGGAVTESLIGDGIFPGNTAYNNIKLTLASGNITGNFHLYGISGT